MRKLTLPLGLLGISAVLVGCNSGDTTVADASQKVEQQESILVEYINEVASEEGKLQNLFSRTLIEDKELSSMKDSTSTVFKNIEKRTMSLELIQGATTEISDQAEKLKDLKVKSISEKDVKNFQKRSKEIAKSLNDWVDDYDSYLKEQREYFHSLSSDTATYETFSEGLEAINKQHIESNKKLSAIDKQLAELSSARVSVAEQLDTKDD